VHSNLLSEGLKVSQYLHPVLSTSISIEPALGGFVFTLPYTLVEVSVFSKAGPNNIDIAGRVIS
jgi:hypothetical protein